MINLFLINSSKGILQSQLWDKMKLHVLSHIAEKSKEEITFNISQYIRTLQNISIEIDTSKSDLDNFSYRYEYILNNLGIKLSSSEKNSILETIKQKYLSQYPESSNKSIAHYISRPSKDVWRVFTSSDSRPWILSYSGENEVEELFIEYILKRFSED